ncbi:paramyosin, short form isoform X2 [Maniola hyperantus]|uniref:paramyosin, short form isoform X2 n=1 Tax=Aphantopus hyperantus TaxID=2795564 RepID=UPI00156933C0|nr:paramyosin, short form isoform X2 [Maniola hyperantus]
MAPVKVPELNKWSKPPTAIYENNYGYGINFYQPMLDYITAKKMGAEVKPPHLPWNNERGLEKYRFDKPVKTYSENDLLKISKEVAEKARNDLNTFQVAKRSPFSVVATAAATNLTKHVAAESVTVKTRRKKVERENISTVESVRGRRALERETDFVGSDLKLGSELKGKAKVYRGKSAKAIAQVLLEESNKNLAEGKIKKMQLNVSKVNLDGTVGKVTGHSLSEIGDFKTRNMIKDKLNELAIETGKTPKVCVVQIETEIPTINTDYIDKINELKSTIQQFEQLDTFLLHNQSKQTSIEIEQLSARVVEAETRLKTEVTRIKKKLQIQITELELSLDVANKTNIDLQKTIKKQSLQLTEIQTHYDEVQRQLQVTLDQFGVAQRRIQSLTGEVEEIRGNYEQALRAKRSVEQSFEEAQTRINELTVINVNLSSSKAKIEQELGAVAADYDEITKELRIADERYQRVQTELKHTVEHLHEEQERIVKIEAIKKSLEIEVKNISVRLEEVEANAIVGGKRIISKLEARIKDMELELDEEKRRHAETIKILRKKERSLKEIIIQCEEDQKNISLLQDSLEKCTQKMSIYKRQLNEQEGVSQQSVTRVRRFQRELEAAEDRADVAESNLSLIRAKHRTFVTTSTVPGSQVYLVQESRALSTE